jgi:hypothetical protein
VRCQLALKARSATKRHTRSVISSCASLRPQSARHKPGRPAPWERGCQHLSGPSSAQHGTRHGRSHERAASAASMSSSTQTTGLLVLPPRMEWSSGPGDTRTEGRMARSNGSTGSALAIGVVSAPSSAPDDLQEVRLCVSYPDLRGGSRIGAIFDEHAASTATCANRKWTTPRASGSAGPALRWAGATAAEGWAEAEASSATSVPGLAAVFRGRSSNVGIIEPKRAP